MARPQSAAHHTALDPITHFILLPILLLNFGASIYFCIHAGHHRLFAHLVAVLVAFALILLNTKMRIYALRVQDRVIRLEERLRIASLAPSLDLNQLSTRQLIALRFAADADLPSLAHRAIAESMTSKQIKEAITLWRPDLERV